MKRPADIARSRSDAATRPDKLAFTVREVIAATSLSESSIYRAIRNKHLTARKYGTRTIITREDLAAFLKDLPPTSSSPTQDVATGTAHKPDTHGDSDEG
jgi:excisionase family DNA binding protein